MENLKNLELSEMMEISGGINLAYELGYAIGKGIRAILTAKAIVELSSIL
jgi:hypothetical protein